MKKDYTLAQLAAIYCVYKDLSPITHNIICCTCGKTLYIEQVEDCFSLWGHYIPRSVSRKLIYHPLNTHAQCSQCNIYGNKNLVDKRYDEYMIYRYGNNIKEQLLNSKEKTKEYYKEFYITELLKLISKFPELADVVVEKNTGEVLTNLGIIDTENRIEQQFFTYSPTYKGDLDTICKTLHVKSIEWERL